MSKARRACAIIFMGAVFLPSAPIAAQDDPEPAPRLAVGAGTGFTVTRIEDRKVWGLNARLQSYLGQRFVYRGYASLEFAAAGDTNTPTIASLGAEIGINTEQSPWHDFFNLTATVGASLVYFTSGSIPVTWCPSPESCEELNWGYDSGLALAATGTGGIELRVAPRLALYGDVRVYIPSRIGSAGYAKDPHAAFASVALGVILAR